MTGPALFLAILITVVLCILALALGWSRRDELLVLVRIAFRNLFASPMNIIVGLIIFFGVFFIVIIASLLESIDSAMTKSIVGSVAGDVQVYASTSKEPLSLFGTMMGGDPDLDVFDDYSKLERTVAEVPNVAKVVPMGTGGALITSGNTIDLTLADLRESMKKLQGGDTSPALAAQIQSQKEHVRQLVRVIKQDQEYAKDISARVQEPEVAAMIARADTDAFWAEFDKAPFDALELLENQVAPLMVDAELLPMRYVGTDFARFRGAFPSMEIVEGEFVPEGRRGLMIPEFYYEESLKLKTARRLDKIKEGRAEGRSLERDVELRRFVQENQLQIREIVFQLDRLKTERMTKAVTGLLLRTGAADLQASKDALTKKLTGVEARDADVKKELATVEKYTKALAGLSADTAAPLSTLLPLFFYTTEANFQQRYDFFYKELAPLLQLYRVRVGDTFTIKAFTKSGYMQAVNVKVYGTYRFGALAKSPLAGWLSLMDLVSFRELYGHLTAEKIAELKDLKAKAGVKDVAREDAEAALFGGGEPQAVVATNAGVISDDEELGVVAGAPPKRRQELLDRVYAREEMDRGVVLNAAVLLTDPGQAKQTMKDIEAAGTRAGLKLKAVTWHQASGMFGDMVQFAKLGLYVAVGVMFVVALAVIILAMIIATMQRVAQIGTLRAIGAQRTFVLGMIVVETLVVGIVFGTLGMGLGALAVRGLGNAGIAAPNTQLQFLFSGPRLYPSVNPSIVIAAFLLILITCTLSALYPARLATRVSPLRAMQTDE